MFQHFEKCNRIEDFIRMMRLERFKWECEYATTATVASCEICRHWIKFQAGREVTGIRSGAQEVAGAAANIQKTPGAGSPRIGEEKSVSWRKGKQA